MTNAPQPPSTAYADRVAAQTARRAASVAAWTSRFAGAPKRLVRRLEAITAELAVPLGELALDLHAHPETAFEEVRSAAAIAGLVRSAGVEAQVGVHGLATAVRAEFGTRGGRTVALLAEYDALPGLGHACGHNVIAATGVGAFLALHRLALQEPEVFGGRVVLLGTPAEEGHTGKEYLARAGAFDGLDAALMLHPHSYDAADHVWLGRRTLAVTYHGLPAHASAEPFHGRNALDAAALLYTGIGLMRQQLLPIDRVHAIITEGGTRASIIPEEARVDLYVRSADADALRDLSRRVEDAARGAALMAGVGVDLEWDPHPASLPVRSNGPLTERWAMSQQRRGRRPLPLGVVPEQIAASTDFGNVSVRVPGIHPLLRIADPGCALHTRGFAEAAASREALDAVADGTFGLAVTALDFLTDDDLADAVSADFDAAGGVLDVERLFEG